LPERAKLGIKLLSEYGDSQSRKEQASVLAVVVVVYGIGPSSADEWMTAAVTVLQGIARLFFAYTKSHAVLLCMAFFTGQKIESEGRWFPE